MTSELALSSLSQLAASATTQDVSSAVFGESGKTPEQLQRHCIGTLHKVVNEAGVVLLVLDARDPVGCRSRLVEEEVCARRRTSGSWSCLIRSARSVHPLPLSHSRIDLVSRENAQAWMTHLRHTKRQADTSAQIGLVTTLRTQRVRYVRVLF